MDGMPHRNVGRRVAPGIDDAIGTAVLAATDYDALFVAMSEGVAVHELCRDAAGSVVDYRIVAVNPAFERILGLSADNVVGKLSRPAYGTEEPPYLDRYAVVAETGLPQSFETYFPPLDRHFQVNVFSPGPDRFATVFMDITDRVEAAKSLRLALEERDVLLKELYHRTKNNLQFVSGLIALEMEGLEDEAFRATLRDLELKIQGMAIVHRRLYESRNLESIALDEYLGELVPSIVNSCAGSRLELDFRCDRLEASVDPAVAIGLVVNELIQNIGKHAYPGHADGPIRVSLRRRPDAIGCLELVVADDGVGLPRDFESRRRKSTGLSLSEALVRERLRGTLAFESTRDGKPRDRHARGTTCRAAFPESALR